jgi:hypothetical protein
MKRRYIALIAVAVVLVLVVVFLVPTLTIWPVQAIAEAKGGVLTGTPFTDRVDFGKVPLGAITVKVAYLENTSKVPNYVKVFVFGSVSGMVKVSPNPFTLEKGERRDIKLTLTMPDSAETGKKFTGKVVILHLPKRLW